MRRILCLGTLSVVFMVVFAAPVWAQQTTTITEQGNGTATTTPENCQNPPGDRVCTTTIRGSITGTPITNTNTTQGIVGTFTADYDEATVTGTTFSVPATGDVTLTDDDGSKLDLLATGTLSGPISPAGAPLTFTGTFEVQEGTGQFKGATGDGNISATLTGSGTSAGTFTASLSGELTTQTPDDPDLTIMKEVDEDSVDVGDELTYTITVTNNEETGDPVSGLRIRDMLPDNVELVDVQEGDNIADCPIQNDDRVRCALDPLGPGEKAVLTITVEPQEEGEIENVVRLLLDGTVIDEDRVSTDVNNGEDNVDEKVCVKHYAGKSGKYNYIYISEQGYENGHRRHGDKIVDDDYCKKSNEAKKDIKDKKVKKVQKDAKNKKKSSRTSS